MRRGRFPSRMRAHGRCTSEVLAPDRLMRGNDNVTPTSILRASELGVVVRRGSWRGEVICPSMASPTTSMIASLVGRERETAALDARLSALREHGLAVLLSGEAGVGKSALLAVAAARGESEGVRLLSVSGVRSEAHIAFAGLHQMLRPLLERVQRLPRPQRNALMATFGMEFGMDDASAPDNFLIGLGALEVLAEEAKKNPLMVVIDDAHWLDPSTAEVLGMVARRLGPEPVALLMAVRDGFETALLEYGLPELRIRPLDRQSSGALLDSVAPGLSNGLRARVVAASAGNPLALVELGVAVSSDPCDPSDLSEGSPRQERLPMTARLEQALAGRFRCLPSATRRVLLIASVDQEACLSEVLTAAAFLGENATAALDDLAPAVAGGVVQHDHKRISFGHPLLPAAIYRGATTTERQGAHAALAAALTSRPDRRAWHRAASTAKPDEDVAAEIEQTLLTASSSRRTSIMLAAVERAAELTPDTHRRGRRLLRAAELAVELGRLDRARDLLGAIGHASCEPLERARLWLVRDRAEPGRQAGPNVLASLVEAATLAGSRGEIDLALEFLCAAAMRFWWAGSGCGGRPQIVAAAQRVPAPQNDLRVLSILGITDPAGHAHVLSEVAAHTPPDACDPETAHAVGTALHVTGALELSTTFLAVAVTGLRRQGGLWLLAQALAQLARNAVSTGNLKIASTVAEEAVSLARQTRQPLWEATAQTAQAMVASVRGENELAESLLSEASALALPQTASAALSDIQLARALAALSDGRHDEAFEHLQRTFDPHDPTHHDFRSAWCIGEYAEAALRSGHIDEAREQLTTSEDLAQSSSPRLVVGLLYARPLLADDAAAEAHFQAGLAANLNHWPLYRARLLLEYGTWLRRHRKIAQARMPLRSALDAFVALGAVPWAERARQELRAARETRRC